MASHGIKDDLRQVLDAPLLEHSQWSRVVDICGASCAQIDDYPVLGPMRIELIWFNLHSVRDNGQT